MSEVGDLLTLPELARFARVKNRTLLSWLEQGVLTPSIQASRGKGVPNLFSRQDAFVARVVSDLRGAGVGLARLKDAADALRSIQAPAGQGLVLVLNGDIAIREETESLRETLTESGPGLAYHLGPALHAVGLAGATTQ